MAFSLLYFFFCQSVSSTTGKWATIITTRRFWSQCMGNQLLAKASSGTFRCSILPRGFSLCRNTREGIRATAYGTRVQPLRVPKEQGFLHVDSSLGEQHQHFYVNGLGHVCSFSRGRRRVVPSRSVTLPLADYVGNGLLGGMLLSGFC
ncbi:hypothetical protein LZ32DRAFT_378294 [Colletotrichum eremochloae]|nr:hypothetical protein LZ32DRAFT_378294 [Colletotrichum eremochloae]